MFRDKLRSMRPALSERLGENHIIKIDTLVAISEAALRRETAIEFGANGLPTTFVPARSVLFFCVPAHGPSFAGRGLAVKIYSTSLWNKHIAVIWATAVSDFLRTMVRGECPACTLRTQG